MAKTGALNRITDVNGITVGNRHDADLASGVTVVLTDTSAKAAALVVGGAPGTRELDAIGLQGSVGECHGIVLSGGSAFGLDAATGVQSYLREMGRGFPVGPARVPIVPQAILFDLLNGGNKDWGRHPPYRDMAYNAASSSGSAFELGASGAGFGATVARGPGLRIRGGLGSASQLVSRPAHIDEPTITVGALVAVNAVGSVTVAGTGHFWAAPYEIEHEFGGKGLPVLMPVDATEPALKLLMPVNTTLAVIATDAALLPAQCHRLASMASAGMARAITPAFAPFDGDIIFALSTGTRQLVDPAYEVTIIGAAAANCLARAIARGVYEAAGALPDGTPCYRDLFAA